MNMIPETEELDVTGVKVTPSPPFEEFQGIVYLIKVVWNFSDWIPRMKRLVIQKDPEGNDRENRN